MRTARDHRAASTSIISVAFSNMGGVLINRMTGKKILNTSNPSAEPAANSAIRA
jgi:hypothetical protein